MCSICDGETHEEFQARQRERIEKVGFTMMSVEAGPDRPPWLYTIGLVEHDHPELLIYGQPIEVSCPLIHEMAHRVVDGDAFDDGELVEFAPYEFRLEEVDYRLWDGDTFTQWHAYYAWLGADVPEPHALGLVPYGPTNVISLATARRPNPATRRNRYRPLHA